MQSRRTLFETFGALFTNRNDESIIGRRTRKYSEQGGWWLKVYECANWDLTKVKYILHLTVEEVFNFMVYQNLKSYYDKDIYDIQVDNSKKKNKVK